MKADKAVKSYIRPSIAAAAILAIVFAHFAVSQFISFESRIDSLLTESVGKHAVKIKTQYEAKTSDTTVTSKEDAAAPAVPDSDTDRIAPRQTLTKPTMVKKKEAPRESKAERLRRAEKLLTGV